MSNPENDPENRVVGVVLIAAILLVVGLALGFGMSRAGSGGEHADAVETTGVVEAQPAASPVAVAVAVAAVPVSRNDASVLIENGVVKMYFASGEFELASGALIALGDAIDAAKAGKRLVVSGFHDATGDPTMNAELAKKRAMSVRDALVGAGVPESALVLKKPEQASGNANADEARRVEVTIVG